MPAGQKANGGHSPAKQAPRHFWSQIVTSIHLPRPNINTTETTGNILSTNSINNILLRSDTSQPAHPLSLITQKPFLTFDLKPAPLFLPRKPREHIPLTFGPGGP